MNSDIIRQHITSILKFMEPHWEFVNCHMVDYFTKEHWKQFVPKQLDLEVQNVKDLEECINVFYSEKTQSLQNKFPNLLEYLEMVESNTLKYCTEIITTKNEFCTFLGQDITQNNFLKKFMSLKKGHEVEIMANMVNNFIKKFSIDNSCNEVYVIDAGDGKGYFSSYLALQYKQKILGVDLKETNTQNALIRSKKLNRFWISSEDANLRPSITDCSTFYKTQTCFISSSMDISNLLQTSFPEIRKSQFPPAVCLTGLHTCGNLSSSCLRIFHSQKSFKLLCNIGCCYHLIKEEFSNDEFIVDKNNSNHLNDEIGFPMSKFLKRKRIHLGRNARMLASQCKERTMILKEKPNESLFYRALLEVLLASRHPELTKTLRVGKLKKFKSFKDYLHLVAKKEINLPTFSIEEICFIQQQYANQKLYLQLFYLLRMTFAPVIESLILLDRLLYLKESGYEQSYLVSLFDAVISPRRYAIFAMKN